MVILPVFWSDKRNCFGLGYISPVSTLVKWFPDRRDLATGLAIMGFGFGGLICTYLIDVFNPAKAEIVLPSEISANEYVQLQSNNSDQAEAIILNTPALEEFKANEAELMEMQSQRGEETTAYRNLKKETAPFHIVVLYEKTSIATAFLALGIIYVLVMLPSALYIAPPPPEYAEQFLTQASTATKQNLINVPDVSAFDALKTPGFYGLWIMLFINVSCGIAVIATAKKMGYEMVHLSVEMASLLVMGISLFNGIGISTF